MLVWQRLLWRTLTGECEESTTSPPKKPVVEPIEYSKFPSFTPFRTYPHAQPLFYEVKAATLIIPLTLVSTSGLLLFTSCRCIRPLPQTWKPSTGTCHTRPYGMRKLSPGLFAMNLLSCCLENSLEKKLKRDRKLDSRQT